MAYSYKLIKHIAMLSETQYGSKQVNIVSHNNSTPKYDIRIWGKDGTMGKGVTLDDKEWQILCDYTGNNITDKSDGTDYFEMLNEIGWLSEIDYGTYEILMDEFGVEVECGATVSYDDEDNYMLYSIELKADESKFSRCVSTLNVMNKFFSDIIISGNAFMDSRDETCYVTIKGKIPLCGDETPCRLEELEDFLSFNAKFINEIGIKHTREMYLDNILVIGDMQSCVHDDHNRDEVSVLIHFVKRDGSIFSIKSKACYCEKCKIFFMRRYDYRDMKEKAENAIMLCREISQEKYYQDPDFSKMNLNEHSVLNIFGYNVNSLDNLSDEQRQAILANIVDRKILSKSQVASYLAYFIRLNSSKTKDFKDALDKWKRDRDFILDYDVNSRRDIEPSTIKVTKYIKLK